MSLLPRITGVVGAVCVSTILISMTPVSTASFSATGTGTINITTSFPVQTVETDLLGEEVDSNTTVEIPLPVQMSIVDPAVPLTPIPEDEVNPEPVIEQATPIVDPPSEEPTPVAPQEPIAEPIEELAPVTEPPVESAEPVVDMVSIDQIGDDES